MYEFKTRTWTRNHVFYASMVSIWVADIGLSFSARFWPVPASSTSPAPGLSFTPFSSLSSPNSPKTASFNTRIIMDLQHRFRHWPEAHDVVGDILRRAWEKFRGSGMLPQDMFATAITERKKSVLRSLLFAGVAGDERQRLTVLTSRLRCSKPSSVTLLLLLPRRRCVRKWSDLRSRPGGLRALS